jgi:hypothetical protein
MPTEEFTVFYAWQSSCPSRDNRNFIEAAIKVALEAIQKNGSIQASPRLDKDTKGVTGIPDIANTILEKIRASDVFVADISFIAKTEGDKKLIPNPNVMIELGYALSELGWERIIIVLNSATGTTDDLPFDLKNRRWPFVYEVKPEANTADRSEARKGLTKQLQEAIEAIAKLPSRQKRGPIAQRLDALETVVPSLSSSITQLTTMMNVLGNFQKVAPATASESIDPKAKCQTKLTELIQRVSDGKFHGLRFQQGIFAVVILSANVPPALEIFGSEIEQRLNLGLQPLGSNSWSHRISGNYLITIADSKRENGKETFGSVTEVKSDGCINAASYEVLNISSEFWAMAGQKAPVDTVNIPSTAFEKEIIEGVFSYLKTLKALDIKGPWYVGFGLINVKKSILHVSQRFMFGGKVFEGDEIRPPVIEIQADTDLTDQRFQPVARALRPAFDFIWREHNYPRSLNYAGTGDWVGSN